VVAFIVKMVFGICGRKKNDDDYSDWSSEGEWVKESDMYDRGLASYQIDEMEDNLLEKKRRFLKEYKIDEVFQKLRKREGTPAEHRWMFEKLTNAEAQMTIFHKTAEVVRKVALEYEGRQEKDEKTGEVRFLPPKIKVTSTKTFEELPDFEQKELKRVFSLYDLDDSGDIGRSELKNFLVDSKRLLVSEYNRQKFSSFYDRCALDVMLKEMDSGGDGTISFEEFGNFFARRWDACNFYKAAEAVKKGPGISAMLAGDD